MVIAGSEGAGRKIRGKVILQRERCKGCGFCVEFCPTHVLEMDKGLNNKGYHTPMVVSAEACSGCDLCGLYCPDFAIFGIRIPRDSSEKQEIV